MEPQLRFIVLNAGTKTRSDFARGAAPLPVSFYRSKEMLLHIDRGGEIVFLDKNSPLDFRGSHVFIRLRANDAHFCGMLTEYFIHHRIPFNDPIHHSYPESAEKISQMLLLALASIPIPETFIFREESFIANNAYLHEKLTYPAVFKTDGSQGRNVRFIERYEDVLPHLDAKRPAKLALVQPFIENTFDTRTIVAYGRVLGTISRTRTSGYLNNIAQGAVPARYELTAQEKDLAIRATHACRIDIGGVDMVHTKNGPLILEVNKSPQVAGFEAVHDFRVFTRIAQMLRDNASQNTSSTAPSVTTSRTDSSTA